MRISYLKRCLEKEAKNIGNPRPPLQHTRDATSPPEGSGIGGSQNSDGKTKASAESEKSSKQLISDLTPTIKTDPEAKCLLADDLAEIRSSASDEGANGQIRYSSSRFSGPGPVEVTVEGCIYHVHHTVYYRALPSQDYGGRKALTGIKCSNFEAVLEFLYTEDKKHLAALEPGDLKEIETWAFENWSHIVLSAALQVRGADVLNAEVLPLVANIYEVPDDNPQFRQFFRETLKDELQRRLENAESTNQLVTLVMSHLHWVSAAITDVTTVLHDLWKTAASKAAFKEQMMRPCGCVGDEKCSGCIGFDNDCDWTRGGWKHEKHDHQNSASEESASIEWSLQEGYDDGDDQPVRLSPDSPGPDAALVNGPGLPPHAFNGLFPGFIEPSHLPTPPPNIAGPPVACPEASGWDPLPLTASPANGYGLNMCNTGPESNATILQGTSALARCVYHWLDNQQAGSRVSVAVGLGCDVEEAEAALDELAELGLVQYAGAAWTRDGEYFIRYTRVGEMPTPTTADQSDNNVCDDRRSGTQSALDATSALARCVHHYMDVPCGLTSRGPWLAIDEVARNTGCTVMEAKTAVDELQEAGIVSCKIGWGNRTYRVGSPDPSETLDW